MTQPDGLDVVVGVGVVEGVDGADTVGEVEGEAPKLREALGVELTLAGAIGQDSRRILPL